MPQADPQGARHGTCHFCLGITGGSVRSVGSAVGLIGVLVAGFSFACRCVIFERLAIGHVKNGSILGARNPPGLGSSDPGRNPASKPPQQMRRKGPGHAPRNSVVF
jgi:hypothetical protein